MSMRVWKFSLWTATLFVATWFVLLVSALVAGKGIDKVSIVVDSDAT